MTPKLKIFENVFPDSSTRHQTTLCRQIWWKSAVAKFPKGRLDYHTKKTLASRNLSQPPFCQKWADRPQNSVNVVTPDLFTWTEFGPDRQRFAEQIPERLIFPPKKSIQYRLSLSAYNNMTLSGRVCWWHHGRRQQQSVWQEASTLRWRQCGVSLGNGISKLEKRALRQCLKQHVTGIRKCGEAGSSRSVGLKMKSGKHKIQMISYVSE